MKKFIIRLLLGIGMVIVLIFAFSGILVFKRNLNVPKVQASPGPACTVSDDLSVSGKIVGLCKTVVAGCINDGDSYGYYGNPKDGICKDGDDIAAVVCPDGYFVVGGGCRQSGGSNGRLGESCPTDDIRYAAKTGSCEDALNALHPHLYTGWFCDYEGSTHWEAAYAICCKLAP